MNKNRNTFFGIAVAAGVLLSLLGSFPATAQTQSPAEECHTMALEKDLAAAASYTKNLELTGLSASQFIDAYVKLLGMTRDDIKPIDTVLLSFDPADPSIVVLSAFKDGCFVGREAMSAETFDKLSAILKDMQANGA